MVGMGDAVLFVEEKGWEKWMLLPFAGTKQVHGARARVLVMWICLLQVTLRRSELR